MDWNNARPNLPTSLSGTFASSLSVAQHNEAADAALEIRFSTPDDFSSPTFRRHAHVERSRRRRGVARRAGLHVFHPRLRHGFVREPDGFIAIAFELRRRLRLVTQKRRKPCLGRVHWFERLILAAFVRESHRETRVEKRDRQI